MLDVGCGYGIVTRAIAAVGFNVHGIDISEKAIEKEKALINGPNATFEVVSAEQLATTGAHFDAIKCSEVLEHFKRA